LSPASVIRFHPRLSRCRSIIASAASRSAVPEARLRHPSLLPTEIALAIPAGTAIFVASVLAPEGLHRCPRIDQRAVYGKVLLAHQPLDARMIDDCLEKLRGDFRLQKPVTVLGERTRIPHGIVRVQAHKPLVKAVELHLLHQKPFRADRIKRLQQQRPQQPFRRDRRASFPRVKPLELRRQLQKRVVHNLSDQTQRMLRMYPALDINVAEKFFVLPVFSAHVRNPPAIRESQFTDLFKKFFSSLLERFRSR
jgi:hypothetical protein